MRWRNIFEPEFGPLFYSKTVLLVNHHKTKIAEANVIFDQGMGTDQDITRAVKQCIVDLFSLFAAGRTGEQPHRNQPFGHPGDGGKVLGGQNLSRGHQTGLKPIIHSDQHTHQGDQCFAAADISLQQTVHLVAGSGILTDFTNHPFLCIGQRER